jgi:hypothetical protein
MIQAPATSKLPMCGTAKTTPRPAARWAKAVLSPSPTVMVPATICSRLITGIRNTSSQ